MSEENFNVSGGSGSGNNNVPDTYEPPVVPINERIPLNKSPVLFLRRRRNTSRVFKEFENSLESEHYPYPKTDRAELTEHNPDAGDIYPNHFSRARQGSVEWVKFRDYKRNNAVWIKSAELVID